MFHIETMSQIFFPANQFNYERIQEVKYTKMQRNQFI